MITRFIIMTVIALSSVIASADDSDYLGARSESNSSNNKTNTQACTVDSSCNPEASVPRLKANTNDTDQEIAASYLHPEGRNKADPKTAEDID